MTVPTTARLIQCDHGLRRQAIVQGVLTDVFQGRLRAGQHLVTQNLAEQFGVSHTPIREALVALAGIGIIDLMPNRGAVVRQVTARDVREICEVRRLLECEATRLAAGRLDLGELQSLASDICGLKSPPETGSHDYIARARAVDSRLHDLIADSCGNGFLASEIGRLKTLFRAFRDVAWEREEARKDYHRGGMEAREHLAIVEALLKSDGRVASRAMALHIRSGGLYWSRSLPAGPGDGSPAPASHTAASRTKTNARRTRRS